MSVTTKPGCLGFLFGIKPQKRQVSKTNKIQTLAPQIDTKPQNIDEKIEMPVRYASRGILLTKTEVPFFHLLRKMTKDYLVIFPHVALRDLISVVVDQSEYFTYYNKIDRKQVDFVLCDPETLKPIFAIELDDSSHNRQDRIERDTFVEKIFEEAKISLVRVPVKNSYDVDELSRLFKEAVGKYMVHKTEQLNKNHTIDNPPLCPKHDVRMVLRTTKQTSERFWGCPNYPYCREIIKLQLT